MTEIDASPVVVSAERGKRNHSNAVGPPVRHPAGVDWLGLKKLDHLA
ncbi:hypothetical protein [Trueperella pyogenes]|nr:hypothetical protein [Trueperella pyogenes]UVJ56089.1 hypothetical protein M1F27_01855 [Trueperella pyogenes]WHU58827.1 hypothetical protein QEV21_09080 [Trueperella pyogenes]